MTCLVVPTSNLEASGSAGNRPGSTSNRSKTGWEKHHLWERCWCTWKS
jgi:hypothetical protein